MVFEGRKIPFDHLPDNRQVDAKIFMHDDVSSRPRTEYFSIRSRPQGYPEPLPIVPHTGTASRRIRSRTRARRPLRLRRRLRCGAPLPSRSTSRLRSNRLRSGSNPRGGQRRCEHHSRPARRHQRRGYFARPDWPQYEESGHALSFRVHRTVPGLVGWVSRQPYRKVRDDGTCRGSASIGRRNTSSMPSSYPVF